MICGRTVISTMTVNCGTAHSQQDVTVLQVPPPSVPDVFDGLITAEDLAQSTLGQDLSLLRSF